MRFGIEQGPIKDKILEQCRRFKKPIPTALQDPPEVALGNELHFEAFCDLHSTRQLTQHGPGPISFIDILTYCKYYEITGSQSKRLIDIVQRLDQRYLEYVANKSDKSS